MKKQSVLSALFKCAGYVALFFACQALAGFLVEAVILTALVFVRGLPFEECQTLYVDVFNGVLYEILILSSLFFFGFLALLQKKNFPEQNQLKRAPSTAVAGSVFLGFAAYLAAGFLMNAATLIPAVQESQESYIETFEAMQNSLFGPWADVVYSCLLAPLGEELLCRGSILTTLKKSMKPYMAVFLSALTFSLIHGNLYQIIFTLPLGLLLGYVAHRFRSVWPAVAVHVAFNATNYLFQLGTFMGFETESTENAFLVYSIYLFCLFSVPLAFLLLREAAKSAPLPKKEEDPLPTPADHFVFQGEKMAAPEYIVVGLGNPGAKYEQNRHNSGFMAVDYIAIRQNAELKKLRFSALTAETELEGKKVLLMKPQTFMNSSGNAVRDAARFYKIPPERILVIFDDISFEPGIFRIRKNGSAGGHNGIKSIIASLSSDQFPRVKIGVGNKPEGWELMNWVLGDLTGKDLDRVIACMEDVYSTAKYFVKDELDKAGALYNGKMHE